MIASAIRLYEYMYKSTVAALIVRGIKCVIIRLQQEYGLQTESTITAVIGTLAYGRNVL